MRIIDADALKYKNLAEVNGRLTYVLTPEEINNAPTVHTKDCEGCPYCPNSNSGIPIGVE